MPAPSSIISDADELVNHVGRWNIVGFVVVVGRTASRPLGLLFNLGLDLEDIQDVPVDENK